MKKIGIIMGSKSDLPVVQKAIDVLKELEIPFEAHIYSAHRTPVEAADFARAARDNGFGTIIAFAGMAAHLAGALLSTVQMPSGIPVATVAVNGGANAALLAAEILSVEDEDLARRLTEKRKAAASAILIQDAELAEELR